MFRSLVLGFKPAIVGASSFQLRTILISKGRFLPVVQFNLSDIGEGIAEVQVKEWHVKVGDRVSQFDNLCEVQSDKASVTITSRYDGVIKKLHYAVDDVARVGKPLMDIEIEGSTEAEKSEEPQTASTTEAVASPEQKAPAETHNLNGKVLATPAVRRLAIENKIDLSKVGGSGKDGRVLKEDVLEFLGHIKRDSFTASIENKRSSPSLSAAVPPKASYRQLTEDKVVPIRGYTRAMVKTMTEALKIPHFGYNDEFTVDNLIHLRHDLKEFAKERDVKLSYMPFFIKACSLALTEFPQLNAVTDGNLENVTWKSSHNICLAMDTPGGLVVPNIKNCEQKNIVEIAQDLNRLHENSKRQQIAREDLTDGTFSLSNIGAIGGTYASPVIFPPQVAIGAIGKIEKLPRFDRNGNVYPAHLVKFSWAADHRVVDGATMARFSNRVKYYIERPATMLAQLR
ncbi:unnamed protein product, partial [Mesorhabditis belari]|uniref:Dihydrolipoamide acetyltransferase component of pyruvate dehydrogenase complex n=1 Tax=Mesorhabditis belari TaxID=2138241 RepID=A0AAF3F4S1_9BILA